MSFSKPIATGSSNDEAVSLKQKYNEVLSSSFVYLELLKVPLHQTDSLLDGAIAKTALWKKAVLPACSVSVFKDLVCKKGVKVEISYGNLKDFETWRAFFYNYTGEEFLDFIKQSRLSRFV